MADVFTSPVSAAFDRFDDSIAEAREDARRGGGDIAGRIAGRIARELLSLNEHLDHLPSAMTAALKSMPNTTDADPARAVLAIGEPYAAGCVGRFIELSGLVLLALEVSGLHVPEKKEASHG
jgi:hypothetical protein